MWQLERRQTCFVVVVAMTARAEQTKDMEQNACNIRNSRSQEINKEMDTEDAGATKDMLGQTTFALPPFEAGAMVKM